MRFRLLFSVPGVRSLGDTATKGIHQVKALSLFVTIEQISLIIGYSCDFHGGDIRGQIARIIRWRRITSALCYHTPMNPLVDMFLVEIFAVRQIAMVDRNGG